MVVDVKDVIVVRVVVVDVDVVSVVVDDVLVVTVVVGVWFQAWFTTVDRRNAPLCEITSIVNVSLLKVMSIKPYWSSFPAGSGVCSEETPPPPPDTTHATGSKKSVYPSLYADVPHSGQISCALSPRFRTNCECLWPETIKSI